MRTDTNKAQNSRANSAQYFTIFLAFISALIVSACAASIKPQPAPPEEVLATLGTRLSAPSSVRIQAKVDYFDDVKHERVVGRDFVISAQAPANLRVTLSSFDKALSTLVTNGERFWLIDTMQNIYAEGSATAENISQILPLYLSAVALFEVLVGDYPTQDLADDWEKTQSLSWDGKVGAYVLSQNKKNGQTQRVYFDYPDKNIVRLEFLEEDKIVYTYEAKDFIDNGALRAYPEKIAFKIPQKEIELRLRVQKRDDNVEFKPQVFTLARPAGIRYVPMP